MQALLHFLPVVVAYIIGSVGLVAGVRAGLAITLLLAESIVRMGQGLAEIFVVLYVTNVLGLTAATFGTLVALRIVPPLFSCISPSRSWRTVDLSSGSGTNTDSEALRHGFYRMTDEGSHPRWLLIAHLLFPVRFPVR